MSSTKTRDAKVAQLLNEAYGKERQLEMALEAHLAVTTRKDYEKRLRQHVKETKSHASSLEKRIKQLGGTAETISLPGPEGATKAAEGLQSAVGKAKAAAQGPLHLAKGHGEQGKMLHNARLEYREEAEEIATYTVIEALADSVGDKDTAKLARGILAQEERMADYLSTLLPELATDFAHDEIPVSEIEGEADHRRSTASGATRRTGGGTSSKTSNKTRSRRKASGAKRS
jgi:ferritin-like metal-binding protein YciE